jgi:hypothetical protein
MGRQTLVKRTCDRCPVGSERAADSTIRFGLGDSRYELDLCEQHAALFHREMLAWQRLATPLDDRDRRSETSPFRGRTSAVNETFTAERQVTLARIAELRQRDAERQRRDTPQTPERKPRVAKQAPAASFPMSGFGWQLTEHAKERAETRGYDIREVLHAAAEPEQTYASPKYGPTAAIHQRGDLAVAVDVATRTIISVLHKTTQQYHPSAHRSTVRSAR